IPDGGSAPPPESVTGMHQADAFGMEPGCILLQCDPHKAIYKTSPSWLRPTWATREKIRGKPMKKILLATSALVALSGAAAAEVVISGDAQIGLKYDNKLPVASTPVTT